MKKAVEFLGKMCVQYKEILLYGIFGVLTTLINIVCFFLLDQMGMNMYLNNTISWIVSVLFAYITNKIFVFESKDCTLKVLLKEGLSFFFFRLLSYFMDMFAMYLLVDIFLLSKMVSKIISNVIVIVANYVFSKVFIFKKKSK